SVFPNFAPGPLELPITNFSEYDILRSFNDPNRYGTTEEAHYRYPSTVTSRMFPTPIQMMEFNLVEQQNEQINPSEGPYGSLLSSTMNWEHQSQPSPHVLPSQQGDLEQEGDLSISEYGGLAGVQASSPGYQSGDGLSVQDSRILDDA